MALLFTISLIVMVSLATSEGANWAGQFKSDSCDNSNCCCPSDYLLAYKTSNGSMEVNITTVGTDCKSNGTKSFYVDESKKQEEIVSVGNFELNNDGNLKVLLYQTNGNKTACITTMKRINSPGTSSNGTYLGSNASSTRSSIWLKFLLTITTILVIVHI